MKRISLGLALIAVALAVACAANPGGDTHTVRPGDTLSGIAAAHGTTTVELVALNKARYPSLEINPALIRVGWQLTLPGQGAASPTPAANGNSPSGGSTPRTWAPPTAEEIRQVELEIIRLTNEARREHGLHELVEDPVLMEIARERARQLASNYSHYGPDGEVLCWELAAQHGYSNPSFVGENIASMTGSTQANAYRSVTVWMNSPGHRENILRPEYTRIGVGVHNPWGARWYGVQIFSS